MKSNLRTKHLLKTLLFIRLDANHKRGMGHLFRMLILAQGLRLEHFEAVFIIREDAAAVKLLQQRGFRYRTFSPAMKEEQIINAALLRTGNLPAIWIFDLLDTQQSWIALLKKKGIRVVCFDDKKVGLRSADLVINSLAQLWGKYKVSTIKALLKEGIDYCIINPRAWHYRKKRTIGAIKPLTVAITMGGSDTHGCTVSMVKAMASCGRLRIKVFTGPNFLHQQELMTVLGKNNKHIVVKHMVRDLHRELTAADAVICNGGITLLEVCAMGLPALAFANEPHEAGLIRYLESLGACVAIGAQKELNIRSIRLKCEQALLNRAGLNIISALALKAVNDGTRKCIKAILNCG